MFVSGCPGRSCWPQKAHGISEYADLRSPLRSRGIGTARLRPEPVERALHAAPALVQDVGIDHGRTHVPVSEQLLNRSNVVAGLQQVRGKGVPERVACRRSGNAGRPHGVFDRSLEHRFVKVMASALTGPGVQVEARGGKHPLPGPFPRRVRILGSQSAWNRRRSSACRLSVWFCVEALTSLAARLERNAVNSEAPKSRGCRLPWKLTEAADPGRVRLLGSAAVVSESRFLPEPDHQNGAGRRGPRECRRGFGAQPRLVKDGSGCRRGCSARRSTCRMCRGCVTARRRRGFRHPA